MGVSSSNRPMTRIALDKFNHYRVSDLDFTYDDNLALNWIKLSIALN